MITSTDNIPSSPGIYKLINKITNKSYIGKSNNLRERIGIHKNSFRRMRNDSYIKRAIIKYGWKNFDVSILHIQKYYNNKILLKLEADLIKDNKTLVPHGYNILASSVDCSGYKHTPHAIEKIRAASKGRRHTKDSRQKLSQSLSGSKNPMYGKTMSDITKEKISNAMRGMKNPFYGKHHTKETIKRLKQSHKTQDFSHLKRPVRQLDIETGNEIKIWKSASEASIVLNGNSTSAIQQVCRATPDKRGYITKTALGFRWEYVK